MIRDGKGTWERGDVEGTTGSNQLGRAGQQRGDLELRVPPKMTEHSLFLSALRRRSYSVLLATITLAWWMNLAESLCREITDMGSWEQGTKWTEGNPHR